MKLTIEDTISKSAAEIFDAIVSPEKLTNHFVNSASGPLEEKKTIYWDFGPNGNANIRVMAITKNERIEFTWQATGLTTTVIIKLEPISVNNTKIIITEGDWRLDKDSVNLEIGQAQGWTGFIDGLKAYLLFNINLKEGKKL